MMKYSIDTIKEKRADILKAATFDYNNLRESDRRAAAEILKPGQTMGFATYNGFYNESNREKAKEVLQSYDAKMRELLNEVETELNNLAAKAPTNEQTNLLTVLSIGNPTKEELQNVLNANKDNYAMYSAINRLAVENGYHLEGESPLQELSDLKASLTSGSSRLDVTKAETFLNNSFNQFEEIMTN